MKKLLVFGLVVASLFTFSACGKKNNVDINNCLIEQRQNIFVANDKMYCVTLSSGLREQNYAFDGKIGSMTEFGILTLARLDNKPLAEDDYAFIITIGDEKFTGYLTPSEVDNTYSADLGRKINDDATITASIGFTGYNFEESLTNVSKNFTVDANTAIKLANENLQDSMKNLTSEPNTNLEAVMKIIKDYSTSETQNFYWYIGVVSTNGETIGILIDTNTGDIIAKKV